jgi:hypothetical protein
MELGPDFSKRTAASALVSPAGGVVTMDATAAVAAGGGARVIGERVADAWGDFTSMLTVHQLIDPVSLATIVPMQPNFIIPGHQ